MAPPVCNYRDVSVCDIHDEPVIRVVVELWPGGDDSRREVLGQVAIANVTPYSDPATYISVRLDASEQLTHAGSVEAHHRADGWAALVVAALQNQAGHESGAAVEVAIEMAQRLRQGTSQLVTAVSRDDGATIASGEHAAEHELELDLSDDDLAGLETVARRHAMTPEQCARQAIGSYLGLGTR